MNRNGLFGGVPIGSYFNEPPVYMRNGGSPMDRFRAADQASMKTYQKAFENTPGTVAAKAKAMTDKMNKRDNDDRPKVDKDALASILSGGASSVSPVATPIYNPVMDDPYIVGDGEGDGLGTDAFGNTTYIGQQAPRPIIGQSYPTIISQGIGDVGEAIYADPIGVGKGIASAAYQGGKDFLTDPTGTIYNYGKGVIDSAKNIGTKSLSDYLPAGVDEFTATPEQMTEARQAKLSDYLNASALVPAAGVAAATARTGGKLAGQGIELAGQGIELAGQGIEAGLDQAFPVSSSLSTVTGRFDGNINKSDDIFSKKMMFHGTPTESFTPMQKVRLADGREIVIETYDGDGMRNALPEGSVVIDDMPLGALTVAQSGSGEANLEPGTDAALGRTSNFGKAQGFGNYLSQSPKAATNYRYVNTGPSDERSSAIKNAVRRIEGIDSLGDNLSLVEKIKLLDGEEGENLEILRQKEKAELEFNRDRSLEELNMASVKIAKDPINTAGSYSPGQFGKTSTGTFVKDSGISLEEKFLDTHNIDYFTELKQSDPSKYYKELIKYKDYENKKSLEDLNERVLYLENHPDSPLKRTVSFLGDSNEADDALKEISDLKKLKFELMDGEDDSMFEFNQFRRSHRDALIDLNDFNSQPKSQTTFGPLRGALYMAEEDGSKLGGIFDYDAPIDSQSLNAAIVSLGLDKVQQRTGMIFKQNEDGIFMPAFHPDPELKLAESGITQRAFAPKDDREAKAYMDAGVMDRGEVDSFEARSSTPLTLFGEKIENPKNVIYMGDEVTPKLIKKYQYGGSVNRGLGSV